MRAIGKLSATYVPVAACVNVIIIFCLVCRLVSSNV